MNVLITAASRRVPLVQAFRQALSSLGVPGRVVVTDVNPLSPAVHVADRAYRVPLAHDAEYLPALLGEFHPRVANDSPENRARNRRVDIVVLEASS
jgi:hypothetical protein